MRCLLFAATCCLFVTSAVHFLDLHRCDWRGGQTGCNVRMIRSCCPTLKSSCSSVSLQPCEKKILCYNVVIKNGLPLELQLILMICWFSVFKLEKNTFIFIILLWKHVIIHLDSCSPSNNLQIEGYSEKKKEKPTMMYIVLQEHSFFPLNRLVVLVMYETSLYF